MKIETKRLEHLNSRLNAWDQDLRWGHRGVEQLQMFLQQAMAQSQPYGQGTSSGPDSSPHYSRDDPEFVLCPETLATFRMLATGYLLKVPGLLAALDRYEAMLHGVGGSQAGAHQGSSSIS